MSAVPSPASPRAVATILAILVALAFFAAGFAVREGIPETWDEQFDLDIGRHYADRGHSRAKRA